MTAKLQKNETLAEKVVEKLNSANERKNILIGDLNGIVD